MNSTDSPIEELLIAVTGRHRGEKLVEAAKKAGAKGATLALGRGQGRSRFLDFLSLNDVHHDLLFILMGPEKAAVLSAIAGLARGHPKKYGGWAVTFPARGGLFGAPEAAGKLKENNMSPDHKMITAIINHGFADEAMKLARAAGAEGGTILNARGTGTAEDVKFFGISLVPEKEMLFIVAREDKVEAIIRALSEIPNICRPGGGVVFTTDVSRFIVLGHEC